MIQKKKLYLFDLDRTVIDSDHRTPYTKGGDLDLNLYRTLQTHENIMKDTLLPLAATMQTLISQGEEVGIVTARRMMKSDYIMLRKNKIKPSLICSRDLLHRVEHLSECAHKHFKMSDHEYKRIWFKFIKESYPLNEYDIFMYDDHKGVLEVAKEEGFVAIDAIALNIKMKQDVMIAA